MSVAYLPRPYHSCDLEEKLRRLKILYAVTQTMSIEEYEKHVEEALRVEEANEHHNRLW